MVNEEGHEEVCTGVKRTADLQVLNPVNNPTSCFKINCLQFICHTDRCRLYKRPSVRTIIVESFRYNYSTNENNYVPDMINM